MSTLTLVVLTADQLTDLVESVIERTLGVVEADRAEAKPLLVDTQTMAQLLGVSASTVHRLRREGMPIVRVVESVRFDPPAVVAWLKGRST